MAVATVPPRARTASYLSLFGYDPAGDHYRLTRQIVGRRIDLAVPEKSLLLEKVTGAVPHTGGKLFDTDHEDYKTLLRWLKAGAPNDGTETPVPVGVELLPAKVVFAGSGGTAEDRGDGQVLRRLGARRHPAGALPDQ